MKDGRNWRELKEAENRIGLEPWQIEKRNGEMRRFRFFFDLLSIFFPFNINIWMIERFDDKIGKAPLSSQLISAKLSWQLNR